MEQINRVDKDFKRQSFFNNTNIISTITPQTAKQILAENGMMVSEQKASEILIVLLKLANTTLSYETKLSVHKSKH
jgi:hypothetical protein